jgi:hypothetical protein
MFTKPSSWLGIMISEIDGHGIEKGVEQQIRGRTYNVDLITKARIELVVPDTEIDKIGAATRKAALTGAYRRRGNFCPPGGRRGSSAYRRTRRGRHPIAHSRRG